MVDDIIFPNGYGLYRQHPIKLVYEGDWLLTNNDDNEMEVTLSRKLNLSEIAMLFGVSEIELNTDKIGCYVITDDYDEDDMMWNRRDD